jgi:hypothetical protein
MASALHTTGHIKSSDSQHANFLFGRRKDPAPDCGSIAARLSGPILSRALASKNFGPLKADSTLRREAWTARRGYVQQYHCEADHASRGSTRKPTVLLHAAQQSISCRSRRIARDPCSTPEMHVSALTTTQGFWAGLPLWAKRHLDGAPSPAKTIPGSSQPCCACRLMAAQDF